MSPRSNKTIVDSLAFRPRRHRGNKKHIFPVWFIVLLRACVPREWSLANLGERLAYETRCGFQCWSEDATGMWTTTRMMRMTRANELGNYQFSYFGKYTMLEHDEVTAVWKNQEDIKSKRNSRSKHVQQIGLHEICLECTWVQWCIRIVDIKGSDKIKQIKVYASYSLQGLTHFAWTNDWDTSSNKATFIHINPYSHIHFDIPRTIKKEVLISKFN